MNPFGTVNLLVRNNNGTSSIAAEVSWLTEESDWKFVRQWQRGTPRPNSAAARDSLEYAFLAGKRWTFLRYAMERANAYGTWCPEPSRTAACPVQPSSIRKRRGAGPGSA